jgi:hypothetical protein
VPTLAELAARDGITARPDNAQLAAWLDEFSGHPALIEARAQAAAEGELDEPGAQLLRDWAQAVPVAERPHALLAKFELARQGGDPVPHLEFLDARAQYTPAFAAALSTRYAQAGDHARALLKAERAAGIAPFDADQRELAARAALLAQDYTAAERHLLALTLIEPDRPQHAARLQRLREIVAGQQSK